MIFWGALLIGFCLIALVSLIFGKLMLGSFVTATTIFLYTFSICAAVLVMANYFLIWTGIDFQIRLIVPALVNLLAIGVVSFWSYLLSNEHRQSDRTALLTTVTLGLAWVAGVIFMIYMGGGK